MFIPGEVLRGNIKRVMKFSIQAVMNTLQNFVSRINR
jgi:transposase-like protein